MKKEFKHVKTEYVENLSYWFWTREAFSFINHTSGDAWQDYKECWWDHNWLERMCLALLYAFGIPLAYLTFFTFGTYMRRSEALRDVKEGFSLKVRNKNNIAYFTILEMLGGGSNGT